jgi:hypothetical protein
VGAASTLRRWVDGSQAEGTVLQRFVTVAVGLAVLAGLIAINTVIFRVAFDANYVRWYLKNGALIGIVFGLITLVWGDLKGMTGLISAHPHEYVASCLIVGVLPLEGAAALIGTPASWLKGQRREREKAKLVVDRIEALAVEPERSEEQRQQAEEAAEAGRKDIAEMTADIEAIERGEGPPVPPPTGLGPIDVLVAVIFSFAFNLLYAVWMLVIAPTQYVVNLVAGAPARRALASPVRASFRSTPKTISVRRTLKRKALPEGATESGFSASPVAFTSAVASALLFLVSTFA